MTLKEDERNYLISKIKSKYLPKEKQADLKLIFLMNKRLFGDNFYTQLEDKYSDFSTRIYYLVDELCEREKVDDFLAIIRKDYPLFAKRILQSTGQIYQASQLLRSFDFLSAEFNIRQRMVDRSWGFFRVKAHKSIQDWVIWRLTKVAGEDFGGIKKYPIKFNTIYIHNFGELWQTISDYIFSGSSKLNPKNINSEMLSKYLIDQCQTQSIIIVIKDFQLLSQCPNNDIKSNVWKQIITFYSEISRVFENKKNDNTKYFFLFLLEDEGVSQAESPDDIITFNFANIENPKKIFNSWILEYEKQLAEQFDWSKNGENEIKFNQNFYDTYTLISEICDKVFNCKIEEEIKEIWQIK